MDTTPTGITVWLVNNGIILKLFYVELYVFALILKYNKRLIRKRGYGLWKDKSNLGVDYEP